MMKFGVAFGLAAAAGALTGCGAGDSAADRGELSAPVAVRTAVVQAAPESAGWSASGELVAAHRVTVSAKIAGRVDRLPVTEGSRVRTGDLLVRIDAPELESAAAAAKARETAAVSALEVAVRQAERMERLAAEEVVTPRDRELADLARADALASRETAAAQRRMAEANLAYAAVRAEMDAQVVRRHVREGDLAVPGKPLLTLEDLETREVRVTVPSQLEPEPRAGMEAVIRTPGGGEHRTVVDRLEPSTADHVLVLYLKAEGIDRPTGSFVDVRLDSPRTREAIRLPRGSLVRRGPLEGVFVVAGGRAELRWLRLADDGRVQAGLTAGERVVIDPPADLRDGAAVENTDEH